MICLVSDTLPYTGLPGSNCCWSKLHLKTTRNLLINKGTNRYFKFTRKLDSILFNTLDFSKKGLEFLTKIVKEEKRQSIQLKKIINQQTS